MMESARLRAATTVSIALVFLLALLLAAPHAAMADEGEQLAVGTEVDGDETTLNHMGVFISDPAITIGGHYESIECDRNYYETAKSKGRQKRPWELYSWSILDPDTCQSLDPSIVKVSDKLYQSSWNRYSLKYSWTQFKVTPLKAGMTTLVVRNYDGKWAKVPVRIDKSFFDAALEGESSVEPYKYGNESLTGYTWPLADIDAVIDGKQYRATADSNGRYSLAGLPQRGKSNQVSITFSFGGSSFTKAVPVVPSTGLDVGESAQVSEATYTVTSNDKNTVVYQKAPKGKKAVTVPASVVVNNRKYAVAGIASGAFKGTKAKTLTVKTKKLTKKSAKGCLKGSKVKTVKVPKAKKKAYEKIFTKKNAGKKVNVK